MRSTQEEKGGGGRPPKFEEESRPVTVTLPGRILKSLEQVNPDQALALVKCVEVVIGTGDEVKGSVDLIEVLPGKALIVVYSKRSLSRIEWLRLVEIAPARYLLVLPPGMPIERLEVELQDLLETMDVSEETERHLLDELQKMLTKFRRQNSISKGELLLVDVS